MCGIAGAFAHADTAQPVSMSELSALRDAMAARGPDGLGSWCSKDGRIGLAHRRLAIIDLSDSGRQPMSTPDGRLHISFNGEIYNYRALREELVARGQTFRSTSDTEVLLGLYAEWGPAMVERLRGMFAFAIWDEREQTLFLARDPFGIKPLYWADDGSTFRFASQVRPLAQIPGVDTSPDPAGHVGFFLLGSVPEPFTMYRGVRPLPAGHTLVMKRGGIPRTERYFDIRTALLEAGEHPPSRGDRAAALQNALESSVRSHMVADVPVGVFLSAGLDSTTIATFASRAQPESIHTLTLAFREFEGLSDDESVLSAATARRLGTVHTTTTLTQETFQENRDQLLAAMDQPSIDGVNTYFVSRAARGAGMKVALSGVGADELFGGYPSFRNVPRISRLLAPFGRAPWAGRTLRTLSQPWLRLFTSPKAAGLPEYGFTREGAYLLQRALYMPWEIADFLDERTFAEGVESLRILDRMRRDTEGLSTGRQAVCALETSWYMRNQLLRDADWAGMAHSVEIRVPFADVELVRAVATSFATPTPYTKGDMAAASPVPISEDLLRRRKTSFHVPLEHWMRLPRTRRSRGDVHRRWAHHVASRHVPSRRITVMVTDAYGGRGGIAKFNRDLLGAIASHPATREVRTFPRLLAADPEPLPARVSSPVTAPASPWSYAIGVIAAHLGRNKSDLVICGHIHLLPVAWLASVLTGAPLVLVVHGIEAWKMPRRPLIQRLVRRVDRFVAVSGLTRDRFLEWSGVPPDRGSVLPNSVDLEQAGGGRANPALAEGLGLAGKKVIMTLGRLCSQERYKGIDEVLEALPALLREIPSLAYLVVGEGDDRGRLEQKARDLGIADRVRFAGFVPEAEKADYYGLADAFVMPGSGEGFGIVYLEALAAGLPVLGSKLDGSREALRDGELGLLIDPREPVEVVRGIRDVLARPKGVPEGLRYFDISNFTRRCHRIIDDAAD